MFYWSVRDNVQNILSQRSVDLKIKLLSRRFSQKTNERIYFSILATVQDRKTNSFGRISAALQFCFEIYWPLLYYLGSQSCLLQEFVNNFDWRNQMASVIQQEFHCHLELRRSWRIHNKESAICEYFCCILSLLFFNFSHQNFVSGADGYGIIISSRNFTHKSSQLRL